MSQLEFYPELEPVLKLMEDFSWSVSEAIDCSTYAALATACGHRVFAQYEAINLAVRNAASCAHSWHVGHK